MPGPTPVPPKRRARPLLRDLIGEILRRERLDQGRTLADVARAARVSMQYLSELERGRKEASSEVLDAVCGALRIDLSEVLTEVAGTMTSARTAAVRTAPVVRNSYGAYSASAFCLAA